MTWQRRGLLGHFRLEIGMLEATFDVELLVEIPLLCMLKDQVLDPLETHCSSAHTAMTKTSRLQLNSTQRSTAHLLLPAASIGL